MSRLASGLYHHMHIHISCHICISCFWTAPSHTANGLHHHTPYSYHASGLQHHHTPHIVLLNYTIIVIPSIQPVKTWEKIGDSHRPIGHRTGTGSIGHRTVRSVTAQARSVTAQSDRSPHRLDRSPHSPIGHRTGSLGHRTVRSVTAQARSVTAQSDRSPHRLDRSPHSPIGHRTGSIGHRTVRSVTATCKSVFQKLKTGFRKTRLVYFWATVGFLVPDIIPSHLQLFTAADFSSPSHRVPLFKPRVRAPVPNIRMRKINASMKKNS